MNTISPELLTSIAGILISVFCSYFPGFAPRWEALDGAYKRLIMLGALAVASLAIVGLSCTGWFDPIVPCDQAGFERVVGAFVLALVANQSAYLITKG